MKDVDYDRLVATAKFYEDGAGSHVQKAARLTTRKFMPGFPGWQIHWRLCSGNEHYDRGIKAYFIGLTRSLSRAQRKNGFEYISRSVRKSAWIRQTALDAMDYVLFGRFAEGINERAAQIGISNKTYQKLRDPIALGMRFGMDKWGAEFNYQMSQLYFDSKIPSAENDHIIDGPHNFSDRQMMPDPAACASTETDATNVAGKQEPPAPIEENSQHRAS